MTNTNTNQDKKPLNKQQEHWDNTFTNKPNMFGERPSAVAVEAADIFKNEGKTNMLELGGGQGRDTIFFAQSGFQIQVLDYSQCGIEAITEKAQRLGLSQHIKAKCHDIRKAIPFEDNTFDACFSHILYCMALTTPELEFLSSEIRRVLKPGGLNIYTVRHTGDADFATGTHRGENMYEVNGFIVHFFTREKIAHLSEGYEIVAINEFEEGSLPKKLFRVTLRKKGE
jgi:SAM-dependent methyltransferase